MTQTAFSNWIATMGVIGCICALYLSVIDKTSDTVKRKLISVMIVLATITTILTGIVLRNYSFLPEKTMSDLELLNKAEQYYKIQDYFETLTIYSMPQLDTNPIAISNKAYCYENSLGVRKDLTLAKQLYLKAAKLGNDEVEDNAVAYVLNNPESYDEILEVLRMNCDRPCVWEFINSCMLGKSVADRSIAMEFFNLDNEAQINILESSTYVFKDESKDIILENQFIECSINQEKKVKLTILTGYNVTHYADGEIKREPVYRYEYKPLYNVKRKQFTFGMPSTKFISIDDNVS